MCHTHCCTTHEPAHARTERLAAWGSNVTAPVRFVRHKRRCAGTNDGVPSSSLMRCMYLGSAHPQPRVTAHCGGCWRDHNVNCTNGPTQPQHQARTHTPGAAFVVKRSRHANHALRNSTCAGMHGGVEALCTPAARQRAALAALQQHTTTPHADTPRHMQAASAKRPITAHAGAHSVCVQQLEQPEPATLASPIAPPPTPPSHPARATEQGHQPARAPLHPCHHTPARCRPPAFSAAPAAGTRPCAPAAAARARALRAP